MKETRTVITCDACQADISVCGTGCHLAVLDADICKKCLGELHGEVDTEYRRLFHGQVRDRRGGWRQLGEYDG